MINKKLLKPIQNKGATKTDTPSNMVTTDTAQTITGIKTFENGIKGPVLINGTTTIDGVMLVKSDMGIIGMLNMGGSKITNLGTPQYDTDAATKKYADDGPTNMVTTDTVQTITGRKTFTGNTTIEGNLTINNKLTINSGLAITGSTSISGGTLNMGSRKIMDLGAPTLDADAATKKYVDDAIAASLRPYKKFIEKLMKEKNYDK